jgi:SAM-dependent methyltransferase
MNELQRVIGYYRYMHRNRRKFRGNSTRKHIKTIARMVEECGAKTLLDYGCGKARHYRHLRLHEQWGGIMPTLYDPGVMEFQKKPEDAFDGVICVDVMEHIPEAFVEEILQEVIGYATKFVFFNISTELAHKYLPDGRNVHLTVRPPEWWMDRISKINEDRVSVIVDFETPKYKDENRRRRHR